VSRFRSIELSDPQYEHDNLRFLTFKSPALKARGDVSLFVPPEAEGATDVPLILLLHGVACSHWAWALKGGAHEAAAALIGAGELPPAVLAMPSDGLWGDGSGYLPHPTADYERWIIEDVPACVEEVVPAVGPASQWFIAGLSMGGYGALRLGAKYAQRFSGISGHSSVTHFDDMVKFVEEPLAEFGAQGLKDVDPLHWLVLHRDTLPPLRFDCGRDDLLLSSNQRLHEDLERHEIQHEYQEFDGGHEWPYWREHIYDTLRFFGKHCRQHR
jgi:enterochelin esterase-like enzyme